MGYRIQNASFQPNSLKVKMIVHMTVMTLNFRLVTISFTVTGNIVGKAEASRDISNYEIVNQFGMVL